MSALDSVDTTSPYFASLASQHLTKKTQEKSKTAKGETGGKLVAKKTFTETLTSSLSEVSETETDFFIPETMSNEDALQFLLDAVNSSGDALRQRALPDTILSYKKSVKAFVNFVVKNSYDVTESTSGRTVAKRKKFVQIQIIDQKLEHLAAGILANQRDQLKILAKIEEINGLLVDLMS